MFIFSSVLSLHLNRLFMFVLCLMPDNYHLISTFINYICKLHLLPIASHSYVFIYASVGTFGILHLSIESTNY